MRRPQRHEPADPAPNRIGATRQSARPIPLSPSPLPHRPLIPLGQPVGAVLAGWIACAQKSGGHPAAAERHDRAVAQLEEPRDLRRRHAALVTEQFQQPALARIEVA